MTKTKRSKPRKKLEVGLAYIAPPIFTIFFRNSQKNVKIKTVFED